MAIWRNLGWVVLGAVLGNLSAGPTNRAMDRVHEMICPGDRLLAEGLALRKLTIGQGAEDRHKEANAKFEASASCGNPEATAQLGMAYCHGWGVAPDRRRGLAMIRRAYVGGARLTPDWFSDPDVCPAQKP